MSNPHLRALEEALSRKGWRIVAVHPPDCNDVSATWEIQRSTRQPTCFIDFNGMSPDGEDDLTLEESYYCTLRGHPTIDLYFRRVNKSRQLWEQDLAAFIQALDRLSE